MENKMLLAIRIIPGAHSSLIPEKIFKLHKILTMKKEA
jgi:hypothetical protein